MGTPGFGAALEALASLLRGRHTLVLSGAGISTESGIPDYRGPDGRLKGRAPMQYRTFVEDAAARGLYWARSAAGWVRLAAARPNAGHKAVAAMERAAALSGVITQNVDGLHQAAGSRRVVELHGSLAAVRCMSCGTTETRADYQVRLLEENPGWRPEAAAATSKPDGDADLEGTPLEGLRIPACRFCGGVMKPDVVFFGESVPADRVAVAWSRLEAAEALLVLGSSLAVWSGFRFVERAARVGIPVAIVNRGPTRADELAAMKIDAGLGDTLMALAVALGAQRPGESGPSPLPDS